MAYRYKPVQQIHSESHSFLFNILALDSNFQLRTYEAFATRDPHKFLALINLLKILYYKLSPFMRFRKHESEMLEKYLEGEKIIESLDRQIGLILSKNPVTWNKVFNDMLKLYKIILESYRRIPNFMPPFEVTFEFERWEEAGEESGEAP